MQLQRLVDGELAAKDRLALLKGVDQHPEQWRDVALALLEDQVFRQEVALFPSRDGDRMGADTKSALLLENSATVDSKRIWSKPWGVHPLMIAASLLLLVAGYLTGASLRDESPGNRFPTELAKGDDPWKQSHREGNAPAFEQGEAGTLRLVSQSPDRTPVDVPLYQVSELDPAQLYGTDPRAILELRRQLRRRGMDLNIETDLLEGELADGRKLIVPVRNVNLRSYGQ